MNVILLRCLVAVSSIGLSASAVAQDVDESALDDLDRNSAVTTAGLREAAGSTELRAAMRRIALQPNDADALADAGNAALTLGDANAALNFLSRANGLRPRNSRIIAALGSATVRTENPFEALRLFDDAVRLGASERSIAADRALAFDLLGNFARAQQDYNLARTASVSEDLIVRQAISLSLLGQKNDADAMLLPLLQKNSPAAWRARAFMLAARGDTRESAKVAQGFMDARSAQKMERYLKLMPDLTGAQQAAAIHLGHFPANNIGRDSAEIKRVASTIATPAVVRNDSRLIPSGEPLGQKAGKKDAGESEKRSDRKSEREREQKVAVLKPTKANQNSLATDSARARMEEARQAGSAVVKPGALPPPETARPSMRIPLPASFASAAPPSAAVVKTGQPVPTPGFSQPRPAPTSERPATNVQLSSPAIQGPTEQGPPAVVLASNMAVASAVPTSQINTPPTQPSARPFDLAAIVGAIKIPENEQKPSAVPVDLNKLKLAAAKSAVANAAKTVKPDTKTVAKTVVASHPARFWVQIAAGKASALDFDYRRFEKKNPTLFKKQEGWTAAWGRTDRLLVGPFADLKASKKWEADFKKAGGDAFAWKSENGVVVTALKGK